MVDLTTFLKATIDTMTEEEKAALYNQYSTVANLHELELLGYISYTKELNKDAEIMEFLHYYNSQPAIVASVFSGYDASKKYYLFDDNIYSFDTFQELEEKNGFNFDYLALTLATYTIDYEELENDKINNAFSVYYKLQCEEHKRILAEKEQAAENEMLETIASIIK